jgi:small subunit ribosomal protein S15
MSLSIEHKRQVIKDYQRGVGDTGSPEVQIALLSERIRHLTEHFKIHIQDHHSRQGLMTLVARRRKLLDYVKRKDTDRYQQLIAQLGLRK